MRDRTDVPFVRGSVTSEAAAEAKEATASSDMSRVYDLLRKAGDGGMTDKEIEAATGFLHENASARRRRLVQLGRVRDSGYERLTPSGRRAVVWTVGSGETEDGSPQGRPRRPSPLEMDRALAEIRRYVAHGRRTGQGEPNEELQKLGAWLIAIRETLP